MTDFFDGSEGACSICKTMAEDTPGGMHHTGCECYCECDQFICDECRLIDEFLTNIEHWQNGDDKEWCLTCYNDHRLEPLIVAEIDGRLLANFSSPHEFNFNNGEILLGYSKTGARVNQLALDKIEERFKGIKGAIDKYMGGYEMTPAVWDELLRVTDPDFEPQFDYLIVPYPVLKAADKYASAWYERKLVLGKCRTISVADRGTKAAHCDEFFKAAI